MTIITQDMNKIINLPENEYWRIWIEENKINNKYEIFIIVGKTGSQEKIFEFEDRISAQQTLINMTAK